LIPFVACAAADTDYRTVVSCVWWTTAGDTALSNHDAGMHAHMFVQTQFTLVTASLL